jgi:HEAT repeat protein
MSVRDEKRQAVLAAALKAIAEDEPLSTEHHDALSCLEGPDVEAFRKVWTKLPSGARARLIRSLHAAAEDRLRLDYSKLNHVALEDADAKVRLAGIQASLEDRSPRLLEGLLEMLRKDPSGAVRRAAAEDLSRFALLAELEDLDAESTAQVREALLNKVRDNEEEPGVRSSALASLGYFSDPTTAQELAAAFANPALRLGAVRGMGRSADPRWTDRLMPVLGSDDPQMRLEAARALGEIEDERAVRPLSELVDDSEREVRLAVIRALGDIGGEKARESLLYVLEDRDPEVRSAAEDALSNMEFYEDPLGL